MIMKMIKGKESGQQPAKIQSMERLYLLMGGPIFFQTVSAAVELDLFTLLSNHKHLTRLQIAKHLNLTEKPTRTLLSGLVAIKILEKHGDLYRNSELADAYLSYKSPQTMAPIFRWQHHINYKPMFHFLEALKTNKNVGLKELKGTEDTLYARLRHSPVLERIFQEAMESISVQANAMLAKHLDLSQVKYLLDVGGGNGSNIISLAKANPQLMATVFDSKSVCEIARKNIKQKGLSHRLKAWEGNCFKNEFPTKIDAILYCHFFTIYSEEKNRWLLKKTFKALPKGGRVILFNMMQNNDETGPLSTAMGSPYFLTLATGEGMLYTWNEYKSWMKEAGFSDIQTQHLPKDHGVIVGRKK